MNALHAHGAQFGVDTDPIRASHACQDQLERYFAGGGAVSSTHCTNEGGSDSTVDDGRMVHNSPNKRSDLPMPKRLRTSTSADTYSCSDISGIPPGLRKSRSCSIAPTTIPQCGTPLASASSSTVWCTLREKRRCLERPVVPAQMRHGHLGRVGGSLLAHFDDQTTVR